MDSDDDRSRRSSLIDLKSVITLVASSSGSLLGNAKVHVAAACVQILYAGFQILASAALSNGASRTVFPVFRNVLATAPLGIIAFFVERRVRPTLTFTKCSQLLCGGLIGVCLNQLLFLTGLYYTSATFASTIQNLTPALTFVVAVLFGIEKIQLRKLEGQAKILGVLVDKEHVGLSSYLSLEMGVLCLLGNCITWAIWLILQGPILRDYPAYLSAMALTYLFGSVQLAIVAVCFERDLDVWAATFYSDLPALLYGGLVASGVAMTLQGWCAFEGGPVLVAAYQPLQTILVAILSSLVLHETFYLGSLIGGLFVIIGLYLVVWGKAREWKLYRMLERQKGSPIQSSLQSLVVEQGLSEPLLQ
ncbi:hypothetical protein KP509_38G039100 [Ceratopteris richardii]|uniref:WAT1-related protein n=1 Tax=Ceratopteris richardii TaxID=49495 RepID=A0A8T2Q436_CERRI|nr:hypothetical protein KP509_38G039100 [Ceratopteris richardii]